MKDWLSKNLRTIYLIVFFIVLGLNLSFQTIDNNLPLSIIIISLILISAISLFDVIYGDKSLPPKNRIRFGLRIWYGPHLILATILGLFFIFSDLFLDNSGGYLIGFYFVIGYAIVLQSLTSMRNYYVTLTDKYLIKSDLIYWKLSLIQDIQIDTEKIIIQYDGINRYIYLDRIEDSKRQLLIDGIKDRLKHLDTWPNKM